MTETANRHRVAPFIVLAFVSAFGATHAPANGDPAALRADVLDTLANLVLSDETIDPAVRNEAVALLGRYGGEQFTAVLLQRLETANANNDKVTALRALGALGDTTAVPTLRELFKAPEVHRAGDDLRWSVAAAAGDALVQLRDKGTAVVLEALDGLDAEMRRRAVRTVARSDQLATVERLAPLAHDRDRWVRLDVATTLGALGDTAAVPALKPLLDDADPEVRLQAAKSLARLGNGDGADQLERVKTLDSQHALVLRLLARLDPEQHLSALLDHLREDAPNDELDDVAALLAQCEPDLVVPAMIEACADDEAQLRAHAAALLGRLRVRDAVETLIALLKDPSWDVRREAAAALGRIGPTAALPGLRTLARQLKSRVRDETSAPVREACAVALVRLGDPDSAVPICLFSVGEHKRLAVTPEVAALVNGTTIEQALIDSIRRPDQGRPIQDLLDELHTLALMHSRAAGLLIEDLLRDRPYTTMHAIDVPRVWAGLLDALAACGSAPAARTAALYADHEIPLVRVAACRAILRLTTPQDTKEPKGD